MAPSFPRENSSSEQNSEYLVQKAHLLLKNQNLEMIQIQSCCVALLWNSHRLPTKSSFIHWWIASHLWHRLFKVFITLVIVSLCGPVLQNFVLTQWSSKIASTTLCTEHLHASSHSHCKEYFQRESQVYICCSSPPSLRVRPWENHLISLSLCFLIHKLRGCCDLQKSFQCLNSMTFKLCSFFLKFVVWFFSLVTLI